MQHLHNGLVHAGSLWLLRSRVYIVQPVREPRASWTHPNEPTAVTMFVVAADENPRWEIDMARRTDRPDHWVCTSKRNQEE